MYHSTPLASATTSRATDGGGTEKQQELMPAGWLKNKRKDKRCPRLPTSSLRFEPSIMCTRERKTSDTFPKLPTLLINITNNTIIY